MHTVKDIITMAAITMDSNLFFAARRTSILILNDSNSFYFKEGFMLHFEIGHDTPMD